MIIGEKLTGIVKTVDDFCYLGSWVAGSNKDMNSHEAQAWTAMDKLSRVWKASQISRELKLRVFKTTLVAILLCSSQCWTLRAAQECALNGTYAYLLHKAFNVSYKDHISNVTHSVWISVAIRFNNLP